MSAIAVDLAILVGGLDTNPKHYVLNGSEFRTSSQSTAKRRPIWLVSHSLSCDNFATNKHEGSANQPFPARVFSSHGHHFESDPF